MKRADLEHIIRAAGSIADSRELIIIGSQAILGSFPDAPARLLVSQEADTYPLNAPDKADLIDGSIGEGSPFHGTFGYYAHGVAPNTAVLPKEWQKRLVPVCNENTHGVTGLCLSPVDLAVSKLAAGREKDVEFVSLMLRHGLCSAAFVRDLVPEMPDSHKELILAKLAKCEAVAASSQA